MIVTLLTLPSQGIAEFCFESASSISFLISSFTASHFLQQGLSLLAFFFSSSPAPIELKLLLSSNDDTLRKYRLK
jgi:hypothetical protein